MGRDHAGPGNDAFGKPFYQPFESQELVSKFSHEIGVTMVPFQEVVFSPVQNKYLPKDQLEIGEETWEISGTQIRQALASGGALPSWFSYPEILSELRACYPKKGEKGLCLFFTGLSGAGKSTLAEAVIERLNEIQSRPITLLDGDEVRTHLSKGLTFSKEDRSTSVQRVGYVSSQITKNRGLAIVAMIAPYQKDREWVKQTVNQAGNYVEIFVSTPLSECEKRDVKGLYAKARKGEIQGFTGIDDPYEAPLFSDLSIDTSNLSLEESVNTIIHFLKKEGYIVN